MAQLETPKTSNLTAAVQDYAKAIYTLESRHGAASTTELAALLEVRPASVSGMLRKLSELGLAEHEPGEVATFVRISDSDPEMLRFLGERGIVPGTTLELVERQPFDGPLFVRVGRKTHVLGSVLASAMHVEAA